MSPIAGVLVLAFLLFCPAALGTGTAWLVYRRTRKRWTWLLTPAFVFGWFMLVSVPLVVAGFVLPYWAAMKVAPPPAPPAPVVVPQTPEPSEAATPPAP